MFEISETFTTASSAGYEANNVDLTQGVENTESLFDQDIQEEAGVLEAISNQATASAFDKSTLATLIFTNTNLVKDLTYLRK